jgi:opacity protein-like surface antigen
MMKIKIYTALIVLAVSAEVFASSVSIIFKGGFAPEIGGSMHTGWQAEHLDVYDGINDINRSKSGIKVSTIEKPVGAVAGAEARYTGDTLYFKTGADIVYSCAGGSGSTINDFGSGDEKVDVDYSLWFYYVPVTAGIVIDYWDEVRIFAGGGAAYAYGTFSSSFKSDSIEYDASFSGYGIPLVAELGCEYILTDNAALFCGITYLYGRSSIIENGNDYTRIDFTSLSFTAGLIFFYDFQAD